MVAKALKCNSVVDILETDVEENIFNPEFIEQLNALILCLVENGYPPQYNEEVFDQVMGQVENFKTYN